MILDCGVHSRVQLQHTDDFDGGFLDCAEEGHILLGVMGTCRKVSGEQHPFDQGMSRCHLIKLLFPIISAAFASSSD
jgi:hypothetical protein